MQFADLDPILNQRTERSLRFLKFDRQMASVVIDAEMFRQPRIIAMLLTHFVKKANVSPLVSSRQSGSGSRPRCNLRPLRSLRRAICSTQSQILRRMSFHCSSRRDQFLEATRNRADASLYIAAAAVAPANQTASWCKRRAPRSPIRQIDFSFTRVPWNWP